MSMALFTRMAEERAGHDLLDHADLARVEADQMRRQFADTGAGARAMGRQVEWPERPDPAETAASIVVTTSTMVEHLDELAVRPRIAPLLQGRLGLVGPDRSGARYSPREAFAYGCDPSY